MLLDPVAVERFRTGYRELFGAVTRDDPLYEAVSAGRLYAGMEPPNFVWYLSRLHTAAQRIYDSGGVEVLQRLHTMIVRSTEQHSDAHLAEQLKTAVHPEVERVLVTWPQ